MMSDVLLPKPPGPVRGRPFEKGRSGNPGGRQRGSRNKATLAAAALLAGESEALTRKAVEMALAGDPTAMRLCMERVLPPCRERTVRFSLPPIEAARTGESAVTAALARGEITPGEAERIAGVVDTFVRAIKTTKNEGSGLNLLQILTAGNYDDDNAEDNSDSGDYDETGGDDYEETGDHEETDDCAS
jgi:hypothetical protein